MNLETVAQLLEDRVKIDQEVRTRPEKASYEEVLKIDTQSANLIKKIISHFGPITIDKFGAKASSDAWLLVQHCDHDPLFQEEYLNLMLKTPKSFSSIDIAFLTDRVKINKNEPQVYGTQFHFENGVAKPLPTIDPKNINQRRAAVGLETIQEYASIWDNVDLSEFNV
jgi:hypothetical protein